MKKKLLVALSICVISALISTSCGIFADSSTKEAEKKIREAVGGYFDEMQDGTFASNGFKYSDYAHDAPFSELFFEQDALQEIMGQAMTVLDYEILDASCDKDMYKGECEVELTFVDLDSIIEDLGDDMTAATLGEAVLDKDAPTKKTKIVIDMIIGEPEWIIEDSTEIAELLGEPYTHILFSSDVAEFTEAIDLLFTSLANGDMDTVDALSPDFDSSDFFAVAPEDVPLWEAFFGAVEFEVTGNPRMDGDKVIVDVTLTFPNMTVISQELAGNEDRMLALMKEYFLNLKKYRENDDAFIPLFSPINEEITSAFSDSTFQVEVESEFAFLFDDEGSGLLFAEIPSVLFEYSIDDIAIDDANWNVVELALAELYESGEINQEDYDWYNMILFGEDNGTDVSGEDLIADTFGFAWCHYAEDNISIEIVTEYDSDETYYLCYKLFFNSDWAGVKINFVWFDEDGNQIGIYEGTVRSGSSGRSYVFGDFSMNASASEKITPGKYSVTVVAPDDVVISEGEVEVK